MFFGRSCPHLFFSTLFPITFIMTTCLVLAPIYFNTAHAADVTLAWDANQEKDLAGYKLYYQSDTDKSPYSGTGANQGSSPVTIDLAKLSDPSSPEFILTGLDDGRVYYFVLTAFNTDGIESDYSKQVSTTTSPAVNQAPVADAGMDQAVTEGMLVHLNGTNSSDPEGSISGYQWVQLSGPDVELTDAESIQASFSAPDVDLDVDEESLVFELKVSDADDLSDSDTCIITVTRPVSTATNTASDETEKQTAVPDESPADTATEATDEKEGTAADSEQNNTTDKNNAPTCPVIAESASNDLEFAPVELAVDAYYDLDADDYHLKTQWQLFRDEDMMCMLDTVSTSALTVLQVPAIILEENTAYFWRARFFDNHGASSEWSDDSHFKLGFSETDTNGDGIPDVQAVDNTIDLNSDGIPDVEQAVMKSVMACNKPIGLGIENSQTVNAILSLEAIDPADSDFFDENEKDVNEFPYGMINFKLSVSEPGATAVVTIHFPEPASDSAVWVKFDPIKDTWLDCSEYAVFSADRKSVELELIDGGFGDDDGVANGIIVDPSGLDVSVQADSVMDDSAAVDMSEGNMGSGGGGCFIAGVAEEGARPVDSSTPLVVILLFVGAAYVNRRAN